MSSMLKNFLVLTKGKWWLSILIWFILIAPAQAAVELKVAIKKNINQLQIGSSTPALVKDQSGKQLGQLVPLQGFNAQSSQGNIAIDKWRGKQIIIDPTDAGFVWIGDRWYRGEIRLVASNSGFTAINQVNLEEYLYSVVGAEAIPSWPIEALKAQAVAARTYALYKRQESKNSLYDVDTTTTTQVYKGLNSEYLSTLEAVNTTRGQVLTYGGKIILAVFHSSSGGHTENVEDIWSSPLPYLRAVEDYDQQSPVYQWSKSFSPAQLGKLLGGVGNVKALIPEKTTPLGRVVSIKVVGDRGTKKMTGAQIRQALDLRSTLFAISSSGGDFEILGRGFGHGLGMSQWGAYFMAMQGVSYQDILRHYYQNVLLSKM